MMWRTGTGNRILKGAEAKVFVASVHLMMQHEWFEDETGSYGIPVFDTLTSSQKIAMLHQVTHALFRPEVTMPELTAVLEGTVAAVLQNVYSLLELEVAVTPNKSAIRALVAKACRRIVKGNNPEDRKVPDNFCVDMEEWNYCVQYMHDAILWDQDYLYENLLVDLPPEQGEFVRKGMRIAPEYYQAIAHDPSEQQVGILYDELEALCMTMAKPGIAKPIKSRQKASAKKSSVKKPAAKKPDAKKSSVKKPAVKKPVTKKSNVKKAVAEKPSTKKPAAKKKKPGKKS